MTLPEIIERGGFPIFGMTWQWQQKSVSMSQTYLKLFYFIPSHDYVLHILQLAVVQFNKIL